MLISVFEANIKVFFRTMWDWNIDIIEEFFEEVVFTFASVGVWTRHQNVAWWRPFAVAKIKVVKRLEETQAPAIWFSCLNYLLEKLHLFLHLEHIYHLKRLILGDYIEVEKPQDFNQVHVGLWVKNFLQVLKNKLLVFNRSNCRKRNRFLGLYLRHNFFFINYLRWFFFYWFVVFSFWYILFILVDHLVGSPIDFEMLKIKASY